jgi:hypothetical protein
MLKSKKEKTVRAGGKIATTVYFSQDQFAALKQRSLEIGSPVAEIVRRSVVTYLESDGASEFAKIQQKRDGDIIISGQRKWGKS